MGMLLMCVSVALAQSNHTLTLQAQRVRTKEDAVKTKEAVSLNVRRDAMKSGMTWYSQPQEVEFIHASQTIEVGVRNLAKASDSCELQVVFFVEDRETGERKLQHHHKEKLDLLPGIVTKRRVTSPKTRYSRQTMMVDGNKTKMGSQPYGYIVLLADNTGPFKWAASPEVSPVLRTAEDINAVIKEKKLR